MPVRLTESRIPANFQATDLGQSVAAADNRCTLVSYVSDPIVINRENTYVLFITDAALATAAQTYEWTFTLNDLPPQLEGSDEGEMTFVPTETGTLSILVRVLGAGASEQARIELVQSVVVTNETLETRISTATETPGPGVGNPAVARELINEHNPYYQSLSLASPEGDDKFKCFVFGILSDRIQRQLPERRQQQLDQLAAALNGNVADFGELAAGGVGVAGIRLTLLAMSLDNSPPLAWTELPEEAAARRTADIALRTQLNELDDNVKVDLFNLVRFPKSNIRLCGRIIEKLRDRYFPGTNFNDVLNGMSGTRAQRIMLHYNEGPVIRE